MRVMMLSWNWRWRKTPLFFLLHLILHLGPVVGDVYFHHPRGSNNKLSEVSNNVNSNRRLFDSQNNNGGGYQVGDLCERGCMQPDKYDENNNMQYDPEQKGAMQGGRRSGKRGEEWQTRS